MARKTVIICDLCKRESPEDKLGSIKLKLSHQRKQKEWEVCDDCLSTISVQLGCDKELANGIHFGVHPALVPAVPTAITPDNDEVVEEAEFESAKEKRERLAKSQIEDDEAFVSRKLSERESRASDEPIKTFGEERPQSAKATPAVKASQVNCSHPNKTRPFMGGDNKTMFRRCRDCGANIPMMTQEQAAAYNRADVGGHDLRVGQSESLTEGE